MNAINQSSDAIEASATDPIEAPASKLSFRPEKGVLVIAGTELWERLSFYGLQAILLYYLYYSIADGGLGISTFAALSIVGTYGGIVNISNIMGGWLADRVFSPRAIMAAGGLLIITGHVTLAITPGMTGLLVGLGFLVLGTGLIMPNANASIGAIYSDKPKERDSGFVMYYGFIMLGSLMGPIVTGYLQVDYGFHVAFSAAAVGMLIGLIIFFSGWKRLPKKLAVVNNPVDAKSMKKMIAAVIVFLLIAAPLIIKYVTFDNASELTSYSIFTCIALYFLFFLFSKKTTKIEKLRIASYIPVYISAIVSWVFIFQIFTVFTTMADTTINMTLFGVNLPPAYISSFDVLAAIVFAYFIASFWKMLGKKQPTTVTKMVIGLLIMALAYALLSWFTYLFPHGINLIYVAGPLVIIGIAEMIYSPCLFSMTNQCSPEEYKSQMMALAGMSAAAGFGLTGLTGQIFNAAEHEWLFFGTCMILLVASALLLIICKPIYRKAGL